MASKYTEDYIQGILDQNKQKSEPRSAQKVQGASKYTTEYIQGVLNRSSEKNQSTMQGPLRTKNTSGGQTAAASTAQKEPEKKSFLQSIQEGWQSTPIGKAMLESKPEKNSSLEKPSNTGILDSLTKNELYRQSDALKQRLQANANEGNPLAQLAQYAADQAGNTVKSVGSILMGNPYDYASEYNEAWKKAHGKENSPLESTEKVLKSLMETAGYSAAQTVNSVKNVGSMALGNPYDYATEYAEKWKKEHNAKYTPWEYIGNTAVRNMYAGLGQVQGGLASSADLLLPNFITPEPVQESLDWLKQSSEQVNDWANEFNRETGQKVIPQVLQAAGGMAPDLALAFATGGVSLAGKAPQLAAASTAKNATKAAQAADFMKTAETTVRQALNNPQFRLSFFRTWGDSYEEAKRRGANDAQALAAGTLGSMLGSLIEVGGGVQTQFAEGVEKGLKGILKNAAEEGTEEVLQNLITNSTNAAVFDRTAPLMGSEENAIFNPMRELESFSVGALAGGMMGAPGALRRGNGINDLFPAVDERPQNTYNQGKGVIENGGQANPDLGGNVPVDGGAVYSGGGGVEYEPGGNGQGVSGAAGAGGQGTAQTDAARAQAVTGKDLRSSTTRQLRDLYTKWYAGQITPEEMEFESTRIAKSLVDPKEFSIQPDDSALARAEYLKSTPIYVNQDEKQILLNQFGTKTIPQLNIKLGTKFTENPNGAIGLDVAVQEMAGSGLGATETGSAVDDLSKVVGRPRAEIDEDMVNAQADYIKSKIYSGGESKQTFDEWLAVASEDSEWGAPEEYVQRIAKRYGIGQSADTGIDPNLQSLFDSDPMSAPKDNAPIDMQTLYDTDLSGTAAIPASQTAAPDEYGIASLFRSDPKGPGRSDQAQIDAQTSLREYQEIDPNTLTENTKQNAENQKQNSRTQPDKSGNLVFDAFDRYPIQNRIDYGDSAENIREAEKKRASLKDEIERYIEASGAKKIEINDAKQILSKDKTMEELSRGSRPDVVENLVKIQQEIRNVEKGGRAAQKRKIFKIQQTLFKGILYDLPVTEDTLKRDIPEINFSKAEALKERIKKSTETFVLNSLTPERVFRKMFGDELGNRLINVLIRPVHANESAKIQFINNLLGEARKLGLNEVERKYTQFIGEQIVGKDGNIVTIEDLKNGTISPDSFPDYMDKKERDYMIEHLSNVNPEKVQKAISFYRNVYDQMHKLINDYRLKHGLPEIGWQENYFPHMNEDDPFFQTLKELGIEGVSALPTSIAGETAKFRPNSRWVRNFQQRRGPKTNFDSDLGFEGYVNSVADMLYHTDDIMRLRNFDAVLRGKANDRDIAKTITKVLEDESIQLSDEDMAIIDDVLQGKYMDREAPPEYANLAQWITDYTNKLANKQLLMDRSIEGAGTRFLYNFFSKIESRFARNSVVGNLTSALNNSITLPKIFATTEQKYVYQAIKEIAFGQFKKTGLALESEFLQGKNGVQRLVETRTEKAMRAVMSKTFDPVEEAVSDTAFYAKYLEMLDRGASRNEALTGANDYAAYMMARRTKGARPLFMESKNPAFQLFTMFQTELSNDFASFVMDLPRWAKQKISQGGDEEVRKKLASGAAKYLVYQTALNSLLELATGFAPGPDLLRWLWNFFEEIFNPEEDENPIINAAGATGELAGEVLNQIPGASAAMSLAGLGNGRLPLPEIDLAQARRGIAALFDDPKESPNKYSYAAEQLWNGLIKPSAYTILPFGGNQLRKTIEGGTALVRGGVYKQTKTGEQLQTSVDRNIWNVLRGLPFGKSALLEMGEYYDNGGTPKSARYTEAYKAGYEKSVLEQLFPTSTQSAGNVSYEKLTGGAEGAAEVDNWLTQLAGSTGKDSVLPSNTTPNITADGEKVELSGTDMMEYAQTKQETSYSILSALYPVTDTIPEAAQASYASAAQDYAAAVAKEAVAGVAPAENSWITKVQDQAGVSGTEVTDELLNVMLARAIINSTEGSKNTVGQTISGSKKRNAIQALQNAGFSGQEAVRLYNLLG